MADSPWTFSGESPGISGTDSVTLVDGTTFVVGDHGGDLLTGTHQGLFLLDTRVLSHWVLTVNGARCEPLTVIPNGPFSATFVGRVGHGGTVDSPLTVIRRRHVGRGMREDIEIRNHGLETLDLTVGLEFGSDFAGLFDVKASRTSGQTPSVPVVTGSRAVVSAVHGSESPVDATIVDFEDAPTGSAAGVEWRLGMAPGQAWRTCLEVGIVSDGNHVRPGHLCGEAIGEAIPVSRLESWRRRSPRVHTDDPALGRSAVRALEDLGALRIFDPHDPERVVVAAGAPWFMTLFGRDSLITSWMALPVDHDLARGVLSSLADAQGTRTEPATEEEPGKILHEVRFDRTSTRLLGGSNVYYGTVDATPLFVMLLGEVFRWTGDIDLVRRLLPAADAAVNWIVNRVERDPAGFLSYQRSHPGGLENQGWKDSWDGIRRADGSVVRGRIALCEVQGYVFAAYRARAELARALDDETTAADMESRADDLASRFEETFWLPDRGWYAIGLDSEDVPIDSLTSNIGHLLWSGIVSTGRARLLAERLLSPEMFTGWGVRTLSAANPGYNPLSYHCGSVWPHDSALAAAGLARYGLDREAGAITRALIDAAGHTGGRLPELFGGFDRDELSQPVPYPTSCSPQAWSAAAPLLLIRSMLGLQPDVPRGRLRLRPRLPEGVGRLSLTRLELGGAKVTIEVEGDRAEVTGLPAEIEVTVE